MAKTAHLSAEILRALERLLGVDLDTVARVVIDIKAGQIPIGYTELYGDEEKVLTVVGALSSVEIERK